MGWPPEGGRGAASPAPGRSCSPRAAGRRRVLEAEATPVGPQSDRRGSSCGERAPRWAAPAGPGLGTAFFSWERGAGLWGRGFRRRCQGRGGEGQPVRWGLPIPGLNRCCCLWQVRRRPSWTDKTRRRSRNSRPSPPPPPPPGENTSAHGQPSGTAHSGRGDSSAARVPVRPCEPRTRPRVMDSARPGDTASSESGFSHGLTERSLRRNPFCQVT